MNVDTELRRLGISSVVKAYVLLQNPHIERIDDSLLQDNASGFASSLVGHKSAADFSFRPTASEIDELVIRARYPKKIPELRAEILRAYREFTAAGVVNERLGFRNVRRVTVHAYDDHITANYSAHFGEANDDATEIRLEVYSWKKELEVNLAAP
ncbi:MAG TPA: hypothetical protein VM901_09780 [Bdellovibrionota bacterium]|nr:hypothetical protein [Bdellovibrionota bacterium]